MQENKRIQQLNKEIYTERTKGVKQKQRLIKFSVKYTLPKIIVYNYCPYIWKKNICLKRYPVGYALNTYVESAKYRCRFYRTQTK